jgi:hypothetical protein
VKHGRQKTIIPARLVYLGEACQPNWRRTSLSYSGDRSVARAGRITAFLDEDGEQREQQNLQNQAIPENEPGKLRFPARGTLIQIN